MDASTLFVVHDVRVLVLGGVLILVYDMPYVHFRKTCIGNYIMV
jgi:hypothetical protein